MLTEYTHLRSAITRPATWLLTTGLGAWAWLVLGTPMLTAAAGVLALWLTLLAIIDLKTMTLPDILTYSGLVLGLVLAPLTGLSSWLGSLVGAAVGFLLFATLFFATIKLSGKPGLGFGDVKLLAMLGAWVEAMGIPLILLIAALTAALVLGARTLFGHTSRKHPLPFGPFLALGGWLALLYGDPLWQSLHNMLN